MKRNYICPRNIVVELDPSDSILLDVSSEIGGITNRYDVRGQRWDDDEEDFGD